MRISVPALTHENAMAVKRQLQDAIAAGDAVMDLSAVERLDSCAVALVLEWKRMASDSQLVPTVLGIPEKLQSLFAVYGLSELLEK